MRILKLGGVLSVLLWAGVNFGCGKKPKISGLHLAKVERQDIRDFLALSGMLEPVDQVGLKSEVSGQILRIKAVEGQKVKKGDTLILIDPEQLRNRAARDRISLQRSHILWSQAVRNQTLAESLLAVEGVAPQKLQDLRWQSELARLQLQEDSMALKETNIQLGKTAVLAPLSGYLISLDVKEGEVIVAGTASFGGGTILGTVADLSRRRVTVKVSELDYPNLQLNQPAFISTEAKPGTKFPGRVDYVGKMAKEQADRNIRQFEVRVAVDTLDPLAQKYLPPGATVTVEFTLQEVKGVLGLPYEAVHFETGTQGGAYVLLPASPNSKKQPVQLGANNFNVVEIISGLKEGDSVILDNDEGATSKAKPSGSGRH